MQRLESFGYPDFIALTPNAASNNKCCSDRYFVGRGEEVFQRFWSPGVTFLVVGAIGAVVRIISPLITDKENDPAVIVMDSMGKNIVPILGGHKAGAEEFAYQLSEALSGKCVFTGYSKTEEKISLDSFGTSWGWKRSGKKNDWNFVMIKLARESQILVSQTSGSFLWKSTEAAQNSIKNIDCQNIPSSSVCDIKICSETSPNCCWHPATLWIGIGCERNTSESLVTRALDEALNESGFAKESIAGLATIDLKSDEIALKAIQSREALPIRFYSSKELSSVSIPNPSKLVQEEVGTPSVAESSALLASGKTGVLKFEKHIYKPGNGEIGAVTIAIAESPDPFAPNRGELHLIGSGPGQLGFLTNDSRAALSRSAIWIGYKRYLDLLEPLRRFDQVRIDSSLKNERERCREAIKLAQQGIKVSLVSSGDSGIYGMAGLALEMFLSISKLDRPSFHVHPGISAVQMAAAKIGAPLMHDFCLISLSDCLTPWEHIEERIKAASLSDFVIAFYNPRSLERNWQLQKAIEILLQNRSKTTPIVLARQIGRDDEQVEVHMLGSIPVKKVDMLTLILVGNSSSFFKEGFVVTPRGY